MPAPTTPVTVQVLDFQQNPVAGTTVRVRPANGPVLRASDGAIFAFGPQEFTTDALGVARDTLGNLIALPQSSFLQPTTTAFVIQILGPYGGSWLGTVPVSAGVTLGQLQSTYNWQSVGNPETVQTVQGPGSIRYTDVFQSFVLSGMTVAAGTGLNVTVAAGTAYITNPTNVNADPHATLATAATVSVPASSTVYLDWNGGVQTPSFSVNASAQPANGYVRLATIVTGTASVTTVTNVASGTLPLATPLSAPGTSQLSRLTTTSDATIGGALTVAGNLGVSGVTTFGALNVGASTHSSVTTTGDIILGGKLKANALYGTAGQILTTNAAGLTGWISLPIVDLAAKYGVTGDGITDNTAALNQALADFAQTGAIFMFPWGSVLILGNISIPNDQGTTAAAPGTVGSSVAKAASFAFIGRGKVETTTRNSLTSGTSLILRYVGQAGKITTLGRGVLRCERLTVQSDVTGDSTPFFFTTNGKLDLDINAIGPAFGIGTSGAIQTPQHLGVAPHIDVVQLGGASRTASLTADGSLTSIFGGFGTRIRIGSAERVRCGINAGHYANGWIAEHCFAQQGSANLDMPWGPFINYGDNVSGTEMTAITVEEGYYGSGVRLAHASRANKIGTMAWDPLLTFNYQRDLPPAGVLTSTEQPSGASAPPAPDAVDAGVVGNVTGTVSYVATWTVNGVESVASPVSQVLILSNRQVTVTANQGPAGTSAINLYRTTAGGSVYFFDQQLTAGVVGSGTVSFNDNLLDSGLLATQTPPSLAVSGYLPAGTWVTIANDPIYQLAVAAVPGANTLTLGGGTNLAAGSFLMTEELDALGQPQAGTREYFTVGSVATSGSNYVATLPSTVTVTNNHPRGTNVRVIKSTLNAAITSGTQSIVVSDASMIATGDVIAFHEIVGGVYAPGLVEYRKVTAIAGGGTAWTLTLDAPVSYDHGQGAFIAAYEVTQLTTQPVASAVTKLVSTVTGGQAAVHSQTSITLATIWKDAAQTIPVAVGDRICLDSGAVSYTATGPNVLAPALANTVSRGVTEWFTVVGVDVLSHTVKLDRAPSYSHLNTSTNVLLGPFQFQTAALTHTHYAGARVVPSSMRIDRYLPEAGRIPYQRWFSGYGTVGGEWFQVWSYSGQKTTTTTASLAKGATSIPVADRTGIAPGSYLRIADTTQSNQGYGVAQEMCLVSGSYTGGQTGAGSVPVTLGLFFAYTSGVQVQVGPFDLVTSPLGTYQSGTGGGTGHAGVVIEQSSQFNDVDASSSTAAVVATVQLDPLNRVRSSGPGGVSMHPRLLTAAGGLAHRTVGRKPADTDWIGDLQMLPPDGTEVYENTSGTAYIRHAGVWQPAANVGAANISMTGDPNELIGSGALSVTPGFGQQRALILNPATGQTSSLIHAQGTLATAGIYGDGSTYGLQSNAAAYAARLTQSGTGYDATVLADNPLIYYRLGDAAGSATVADSSTHNNTGTVHGNPGLGGNGMIPDQDTAANFPGSAGNYITSGLPGLVAGASFTLEFTCRPGNFSYNNGSGTGSNWNQETLVCSSNGSSLASEIFYYAPASGQTSNSRLRVNANTSSANDLISQTVIPPGSQIHVIYTYDGSVAQGGTNTEKLWINGVVDTTRQPVYAPNFSSAVSIGQRPTAVSTNFPGPMAGPMGKFALYAGVLSDARIAAHWAATTTVSPKALIYGLGANLSGDLINLTNGASQFRVGSDGTVLAGSVPDARLSANVPLKNTANTFTQNQIVNGTVTGTDGIFNRIVQTGGATPTVVAGANAGVSPPAPTVATGSTDARGVIQFGTGTGATAGAQVALTFGGTYAVAPRAVMLTWANAFSGTISVNISTTSVTATGFTLYVSAALGDSIPATGRSIAYHVIW